MESNLIAQMGEIKKVTDTMIEVATLGVRQSDSQDLILIYSLMLDCAYKIRQTIRLGEKEIYIPHLKCHCEEKEM